MSQSEPLKINSKCGRYQYVEIIPFESGTKGACAVLSLSPQSEGDVKYKKSLENIKVYAEKNGFSSIILVNLYAALDMDPLALPLSTETVGEENDNWILKAAQDSDFLIGAWGDFPRIKNRVYHVMKLLGEYDIYAIQTNRNGSPSHPMAWKKKAAKLYRRGRPEMVKKAG